MGKRFKDNGDGTVTDKEEGLMWKQTDGFQDESMFHTWYKAEDYIRELNNKKFAGYNDWHMPNLEEAEGLYVEEASIRDCDRFEIFIDSAFSPGGGYTTWTSDLKPHNGAVIFYYRYGHPNLSHKEGITHDTVRVVRDNK